MVPPKKQMPPPVQADRWHAPATMAVLLAAQLLACIFWLSADNQLPEGAIATHGAQAAAYREALFGVEAGGMLNRLVRVGDVTPGDPPAPLLTFLGGIALELGNGREDAPALVSVLALLMLTLAVYLFARRVLDPMMAVLAATIVCLLPILYCAGRVFTPDLFRAALLWWTLYAALRSDGFRRGGWSFLAGIFAGLSLLAMSAAWMFLAPLAVVTAIMGLLAIAQDSQRGASEVSDTGLLGVNLLIAFVVACGVAAPWYFRHAEALSAAQAAHDAAAAQTAIVASDPLGLLLDWLSTTINEGVFLPLFVLALIGMIVAPAAPSFRKPAIALLIFWPLLVLFLTIPYLGAPTARALLPLLPALGIFAALPVAAMPRGTARQGVSVVLVAALLIVYGNLSVAPYGTLSRVEVPLSAEENGGTLTVYRDRLNLAPGVPPLGAPVSENRQETLAENVLERAERDEVVRQEEVEQVEDTSEIDGLEAYDLFLLLRSDAFAGLSPALQSHATDRFNTLMSAFPADYKIHDALSFVQADILPLGPDAYEFRFSFRVDGPIGKDWQLFLRGHVSDQDLHFLPPDYRAQGYIEWTAEPKPPTGQWEPGSFVIVPIRVHADPIRYNFKLGFFDPAQGFFGRPVVLDDIDLSTIAG